ncbi:hypothetical protein Acor_17500 [Acrocarpospora corrugata]|uniref:Uncharacterized protein n=1 Tax=Acrocarpospora corrugata TaxID=35763 RepID=A0A5M3VSD1_9ACTN|nr:hypothetical protein [Acrocarpospora corrugata]GER99686.1 hypothetical protein Acor_17500 [Acrocarpospora corrugata]
MRRLFVILGSLVIVAAMAAPAYAGNWAVTELDPLPDRIEADQAYTVGYWMLQHGTHPFGGTEKELGETGLRLTDGKGAVLKFIGSRLPEPAHYAVAVKIPKGTWRVQGIQGVFMDHEIGTLTVPGTLTLAPPQFDLTGGMEVKDYWGEIKPPGFPWKGDISGQVPPTTQAAIPAPTQPSTQPTTQPAPAAATQPNPESTTTIPAYLLAVVAVASIAGTLLLQRIRRRPEASDHEDPSEQDQAPTEARDVLTIGGTRD